MKRILQFVVLVVVALLVAQPLSACAACVQQAENCAPACCGNISGMDGMSSMPGMQTANACMASMDSIPVDSGCGLGSSSLAFLPQAAATLALHEGSKVDGRSQFTLLDSFPVRLRHTRAAQWSEDPIAVTTSKNILFQVFRI